VHSAGLLAEGRTVPTEGVDAARELGLDTSTHRSRLMTAEMVSQADLVTCMAREHVREAVLLVPEAWPRCFTLKELVRRGEAAGPRAPGQALDEWLAKVHAGRTHGEVLGYSTDDDVMDPIGAPQSVYTRVAGELSELVDRLVELAWGSEGAGRSSTEWEGRSAARAGTEGTQSRGADSEGRER
jgi:protein-tyrosine phosphatase